MKRIISIITLCICATIQICYAQEDINEEKVFEPINTTLYPSDNSLQIEDIYNENGSISFIGDELEYRIKNKFGTLSNNFRLPISPRKDYELTFNLTCKNGKSSCISVIVGLYSINLILNKQLKIYRDNQEIFTSTKKWKFPSLENKAEYIFKIVRKNNIVTFYLNKTFLFETKSTNNNLKEMMATIYFNSMSKNSSLIFNSLTIKQGSENKTEDE